MMINKINKSIKAKSCSSISSSPNTKKELFLALKNKKGLAKNNNFSQYNNSTFKAEKSGEVSQYL